MNLRGFDAGHDRRVGAMRQQHVARLVQVAQRRRQSPGPQRRRQRAQPRQRQLQQHAALVAEQFVPFVDDHAAQALEMRGAVGVGQQQRQRFGRDHQHVELAGARQPLVARAGIAGAHADLPVEAERGDRFAQGAHGVGGERAQRRDPEHAQARGARRGGSRSACSSGPPNAASVLPLPVGVCSRPDSPAR